MKKLIIISILCASMSHTAVNAQILSKVSEAVSVAQSVTTAPLFDGISLCGVEYSEKTNIVTIKLMNDWNENVKASTEEQLGQYAKWILSECGEGYKAACSGQRGEGEPESYRTVYKALNTAYTNGAKLSVVLVDEATKKPICGKDKILLGSKEIKNILSNYR